MKSIFHDKQHRESMKKFWKDKKRKTVSRGPKVIERDPNRRKTCMCDSADLHVILLPLLTYRLCSGLVS